MSLNCEEIELVINGLPKIAIINNFYQNNKSSIIVNIFDSNSPYNIKINSFPKFNYICLIPEKVAVERGKNRFAQILNANLSGGKLVDIYQSELSRVVVFLIEINGEIKKMVVRLWDNSENILLLNENNIIIDCLKRYPNRDEWPGEEFIFPQKNSDKKFVVRDIFKDNVENVYYHYTNRESEIVVEKLKNSLLEKIDRDISYNESKLKELAKELNEENIEKNLQIGELLKNNLYQLKDYSDSITLFDYNLDKDVTIKLNNKLTKTESVQYYFDKYRKAKENFGKVLEQKERIEERLNSFNDIKSIVLMTDSYDELLSIEENISENRLKKIVKKGFDSTKTIARMFNLSFGYKAYVSKNSNSVDDLLKTIAKGNDYWFHIRDYEGAHVVVKEIKNRELPDKTRIEAAILALHFSKARSSPHGDIYFTRVKYLHKGKSGIKGLVFPTQEKNIKIDFDKKILDDIIERSATN